MAAFRLRPLLLVLGAVALISMSMPSCGRPDAGASSLQLTISLSTLALSPGQNSELIVTVKTSSVLDAPVLLSLRSPDDTPLPDGLGATFEPATLLPPVGLAVTSKLHLLGQPQLADDTYPLVVYARSQGQEASAKLAVSVSSNVATWRRPIATPGTDQVLALGGDHSGGVFLAVNSTGGFGNGQNQGDFDGYLFHYRDNGAVAALTQLGTASSDVVTALGVDSDDSVYVGGYTYGTFNGQLSAGKADAFLAKIDSRGGLVWLRQFGTGEIDQLLSIAVATDGSIYAAGLSEGAFPTQVNAGGSDVFLSKWSPSGQQLWLTEFGTSSDERTNAVANTAGVAIGVDGQGSVYVAGSTQGAFPGFTNAGGGDAFIARFDSDGKQSWLQQLGSFADEALQALAIHSNGLVYAAGWSRGPLAGQTQLGGQDGFVVAYRSDGSRIFARQLGTSYADVINNIGIVNDQILIIGTTRGAFPGQTQYGGQDVFYARISTDGPTQWLRQVGSSQSDSGTAIGGSQNNLYTAGITFGDFSSSNVVLTQSDGFLNQSPLP